MDYSVKNTNKEQRRDLVKKALTISISGADVPTKETIELAKKYIDGSIELEDLQKQYKRPLLVPILEDLQKQVIEKYKK